jgi:hypothetical protein
MKRFDRCPCISEFPKNSILPPSTARTARTDSFNHERHEPHENRLASGGHRLESIKTPNCSIAGKQHSNSTGKNAFFRVLSGSSRTVKTDSFNHEKHEPHENRLASGGCRLGFIEAPRCSIGENNIRIQRERTLFFVCFVVPHEPENLFFQPRKTRTTRKPPGLGRMPS